jgi:outer membrane lipase/esterase
MMKRFALVALLCSFASVIAPGQAALARTAAFNQYVGFGDSTLDSGYFRFHTTGSASMDQGVAAAVAQGATGGWSGPGLMNSTILAGKFGLSGLAIGGGGFNNANGGAFTEPLRASADLPYLSGVGAPANVSTIHQIQNYLLSMGGAVNPGALYVVKTGDNDTTFVRLMQSLNPNWLAQNPNFLHNISTDLAVSVAALQAAGARKILVPNSYNYAENVGVGGALLPGASTELYVRSYMYMQDHWATMTAVGVRFIPADIDALTKFIVRNPLLFGFTPASVMPANTLAPTISPMMVSWADVTPAQIQSSLFIGQNGVHFTQAGQQIEADYEQSLLTAPTQMSLLAEGPVQGGLSRAATIQGQIDLSGQHRGDTGINVWASGGISSLQIKNYSGFAEETGTPFVGSVGADYQTSFGLILGAAFAAGTQTQDFSQGAGHYDQNDQAISLYTAYKYGPVWGNAVASYGLYQDKISRSVPLGLFMDSNSADTTGDSLGLALRLGGDLKWGPVTTGPVAGLVLQRVTIKGFTESGTSGVTALSYGEQKRDSTVSQLGWRILADVGRFQPFAEAKWNHEFADPKRTVKASLTTISAPAYSMDAVPVTTDWGTVMLGTSFKVSERVMLRASFSSMFSNPNAVTYGGELGVNVSF